MKKYKSLKEKLINLGKISVLLDTRKDTFKIKDLENRRFMYNNKTYELVLGDMKLGSTIGGSHAEEWNDTGARGNYDDAIKGWIGTSSKYKNGIIHFAPPISIDSPYWFNKGFDVLKMFLKVSDVNKKTIIRGFGKQGEIPLEELMP